MTVDRFADFERADAVLRRALDLPAEERRRFVERECGSDPALRDRVLDLIQGASDGPGAMAPGGALSGAIWAGLAGDGLVEESAAGTVLWPWRVCEEIGRGGMATVYRAERADGAFEQRVAVKILSVSRSSERLERRFARERAILSRLEHPNIARLLDGGATPSGRPYLVMEYVEGEPIDRYCDGRRLTVEARLRLFLAVCAAVQTAHRQLVVHRDLKPSNILVTPEGTPKLLDFGIAKLLEPESAEADPTRTALFDRVLTPQYASPEQVVGEPMSTATDVYTLGLLLYELLTGHRAHHINSSRPSAIEQAVCEDDPTAPSAVVRAAVLRPGGDTGMPPASIARARRLAPRALRRRLRGDLDNIVLKALRREPMRRYDSAEQLAEDIRRHLESRPVQARPDRFGYRARKFVGRHRWGVAMGAVMAFVLVGSTVGLAFQADRLARERDRARETASFIVTLLEEFEPWESRGATVAAREILDRATARARRELVGQPLLQADLLEAIGKVYQYRGFFGQAEELLEEALNQRIRILGRGQVKVADSQVNLGILRNSIDRLDNEALFGAAIRTYRNELGHHHPKIIHALTNLALTLRAKGDYPAAESRFREVLALQRQSEEISDVSTATARTYLGKLLTWKGEYEQAEALLREAMALRQDAFGEKHPTVANALEALAELDLARGEYAAAEERLQEVQSMRMAVYEAGHPDLAAGLFNLGVLYREQGAYEKAETALTKALATYRRVFGESLTVADVLVNLGGVYTDLGDLDRAEAMFQQARRIQQRQALEKNHPDRAKMLQEIAALRMAQGEFQSAEQLLREAISILQQGLNRDPLRMGQQPSRHWRIAKIQAALGRCLMRMNRLDEAERLLTASFNILQDAQGIEHADTQGVVRQLAALYETRDESEMEARYRRMVVEAGSH